jgi:hypothetical protein
MVLMTGQQDEAKRGGKRRLVPFYHRCAERGYGMPARAAFGPAFGPTGRPCFAAPKSYGCRTFRSLRIGNARMADNRPPMSPRMILALVMGGLILWGIYVALGVLYYGLNPVGAVLVLVCVGMFLGFWLLLLRTQNRDKQE